MKIVFFVSTTDDENILEFKKNNPQLKNIIFINQLIKKDFSNFKEHPNVITFREKGLSKSRNRGIMQSDADIIVLTDNDIVFVENSEQLICETFNSNPKIDIATFKIMTPQKKSYKNYKSREFKHNIFSIMKVSSAEIVIKRKSIEGIKYDERFGLGTDLPSGEENIFLSLCLARNLQIRFFPKTLCYHEMESSGKNLSNIPTSRAKGYIFKAIFGGLYFLPCFYFAIKKYPIYKKQFSLINYLKILLFDEVNHTTK